MKKVMIVGGGYVGLVTAACLADKNNQVFVVENNPEKFESLTQGKVPFYEPGLDDLVLAGIQNKSLIFVPAISQAMQHQPEIIFSCVGTPSQSDGSADLSYVFAAAQDIGKHLDFYTVVVNKSTAPVGTVKKIQNIIAYELMLKGMNQPFDVASNPEFLREGNAVNDFFFPDRVVAGTNTDRALQVLIDLYAPFIQEQAQFVAMTIESAELTKYASNAMLSLRISFMNQLARLADKTGADIKLIERGMGSDKRIGKYFLQAGIGYGGSCFPKDTKALVNMGVVHDSPMTLMAEVDKINDEQRQLFFEKILTHYDNTLVGKTVGIWGLTFKPNTDDVRCSPAIDIISMLLDHGAQVIVYDPAGMEHVQKLFGDKIIYATDALHVLVVADTLLLLTEWEEFVQRNIADFIFLKDKVIFDGRNCLDVAALVNAGIMYYAFGRQCFVDDEQQILSDIKPHDSNHIQTPHQEITLS